MNNENNITVGEDMTKIVVAKLKSKNENFDELKKFLKEKLPEAKAFDGCKGIHACVDEEKKTIVLYEIWESVDHHQKYVEWRKQQGVHDKISKMLSERSFGYYSFLV